MKIELQQYNRHLYPILQAWFKAHGWSDWDAEGISPHSYFAMINGIPIAFGGIYLAEGCNFSILGFFITNPEVDKLTRSAALDEILINLDIIAKERGYKYIMYSGDSKPLVSRLETHDYIVTDKATAYICIKDLTGKDPKFFYED